MQLSTSGRAIGGLVAIVGVFGLWWCTGSSQREPTVPDRPLQTAPARPADHQQAADRPRVVVPPAAPVDNAEAAPPSVSPARLFRKSLRVALTGAEPVWQKCIQTAVDAGRAAKGDVGLRLIVAKGSAESPTPNFEVVEIAHDRTTLQGDKLLACMTAGARTLKLDGPPPSFDAVAIEFVVEVSAGAVVGATGVDFSFRRDDDSPTD